MVRLDRKWDLFRVVWRGPRFRFLIFACETRNRIPTQCHVVETACCLLACGVSLVFNLQSRCIRKWCGVVSFATQKSMTSHCLGSVVRFFPRTSDVTHTWSNSRLCCRIMYIVNVQPFTQHRWLALGGTTAAHKRSSFFWQSLETIVLIRHQVKSMPPLLAI